uniref:Uncharacterized protein n=1 Tax=Anopheles albimanus TaxID=7167 RepID=A0A182FZC4_ANOAL
MQPRWIVTAINSDFSVSIRSRIDWLASKQCTIVPLVLDT